MSTDNSLSGKRQAAPSDGIYTPTINVRARLEPGGIHFTILDRNWVLHRPLDLESLWESVPDEEFAVDERLPYWVELWPASLVLALWLAENRALIAGKTCLDLGCGLGFTTLVAKLQGANVAGMDYEAAALFFARLNADANHVPGPVWLNMDWRRPALRAGCCDFIWGGDVLYEKRFAAPIFAFLDHALSAAGTVWMAEPGRNTYEYFMNAAIAKGWRTRLVRRERVEALHVQKVPVSVNIWELKRI